MKLITAICLFLSLSAIASIQEKTINFEYGTTHMDFSLEGQKTHTETQYEEVPSTCFQSVYAGQEAHCYWSTGYYTVCGGHGYYSKYNHYGHYGYSCWRPSKYVCTHRPKYIQQAYSCTKTKQTNYQVVDYKQKAHVHVIFEGETISSDKLKFTFGSNLEAGLKLDFLESQYVFEKNATMDLVSEEGNIKTFEMNINVKVLPIFTIANALGSELFDLKVEGRVLSFRTGHIPNALNYKVFIDLEQDKFLGDKKLVSRSIEANEMTVTQDSNSTFFEIDLSNLHERLRDPKEFKAEIEVGVTLDYNFNPENPEIIKDELKVISKLKQKI